MGKGRLHLLISISETISFMLLLFIVAIYAASGSADTQYMGGYAYTVAFWLGFLVYGLFFVLKRFPRLISYPVTITAKNVTVQARLSRLMLSILTLMSMCVIATIFIGLRLADRGIKTRAPIIVIMLCFAGVIADIAIYLIFAKKKA